MSTSESGPSLAAVPSQPSFYSPLKTARSFRLLHFKEAMFEGKTPIYMRFSLDEHELDDSPQFIAISYVWGEPYRKLDVPEEPQNTVPFDRFIEVDEIPFWVSTNMWDALSAALSHGVTAYLWLDGCCINQSDLSERAAQVLLMGDIFAGATLVIGFLGPMHPDLDSFYWLLMDFMPKVSARLIQGEASIVNESLWAVRDHLQMDKRYFDASLLGAFRFYYSCKWFQRAWVKQEVVLARELSLVCGRAKITWDGLNLAGVLFTRSNWTTEFLSYRNHFLYEFVKDNYLCDAFYQWRGFVQYRTDSARAKSFEDVVLTPMWKTNDRRKLECAWLLEFVLSMRSAKCSDPRDKVFAVHGLAAYHCGASIEAIHPDYRVSAAQVYTKLIGSFASFVDTLNFLVLVEPAKLRMTEDLPSWVPDFQSTYFYNGHKVNIAVGGKLFSGHEDTFMNHKSISYSVDKLSFHAIKIGHITNLESEDETLQKSTSRVLLSRLNLCRKMPQLNDGKSRIEMLWRTCIQDNYERPDEQIPHRPAPSELSTSFSAFALFSFCEELSTAANEDRFEQVYRPIESLLKDFRVEVQNKELPTPAMIWEAVRWYAKAGEDLIYETRDPQMENGEEGHDWVLWLKRAVGIWTSAVKKAQTSTLRCFLANDVNLGSANEDVRIGDEIWFAPASSLPLILRPVVTKGDSKMFEFVSVAYLHDMMDGEASLSEPDSLTLLENIILK